MKKHTLGRAAGFVAAIGATTALVAGGVSMTGAYFQDTESGTLSSTTGEVDVSVDSSTPLTSTFANLLPDGPAVSKTYTFSNTGTDAVDLYLKTDTWTLGGAPAPRVPQRAGSSIDNGTITLLKENPDGPGGTSYGWDDIQTHVQNGDTISFEWRHGDGTVDCGDLDDAPRMYIRGGTFNSWNANPVLADRCGVDVGGWRQVVTTVSGIGAGPAGRVAVVNETMERNLEVRNVMIGGTTLTPATNPAPLCDGSVKSGHFEARVSGPNGDTNWFKVCAPHGGANPALVATNVPAEASRTATISLRLNAAAQNDLANKATTANLTVIATQPGSGGPTNQADQSGNDDA